MITSIKLLEYTKQNIGKRIKSFKILHRWKISIENSINSIEYIVFKWRKKRIVNANNIILFKDSKSDKDFSYRVYIASHILTVTEGNKCIDLHIDGFSCIILHKRQADMQVFPEESEEISIPLRWKHVSVYSDTSFKQEIWETKAQNYRLQSRNIPINTQREKLQLYSYRHSTIPFYKSLRNLEIECSPRSSKVSTHFRSSLAQISGPNSRSKMKKYEKSRIMNFFLML